MVARVTRQYVDILAEGSGAARITQQYVDILAQGDGSARVTQQYVEILTEAVPPHFITESLNLVQTIGIQLSLNLDLNEPLSLISVAYVGGHFPLDNTFTLEDEVLYLYHPGAFFPTSSELVLSQTFSIQGYHFLESILELIQEVTLTGPNYQTARNYLYITDTCRNTNIVLNVEEELELLSLAARTREFSLTSTFTLTDEAYRSFTPSSVLTISQSLLIGKTRGAIHEELNIEPTLLFNAIWVRSITQEAGVGHSLTYYFDSSCMEKSFSPFLGESTFESFSDFKLPIQQNAENGITLIYPANGELIQQITLRAPELDDTSTLIFNRINRETRNGKLIVFADADWAKNKTLHLNFYNLTKTEADTTQDFINTTLGEKIRLIDWEGREWSGIIETAEVTIIENREDNWSLAFTFNGSLTGSFAVENNFDINLIDVIGLTIDRARTLEDALEIIDIVDFSVETP